MNGHPTGKKLVTAIVTPFIPMANATRDVDKTRERAADKSSTQPEKVIIFNDSARRPQLNRTSFKYNLLFL